MDMRSLISLVEGRQPITDEFIQKVQVAARRSFGYDLSDGNDDATSHYGSGELRVQIAEAVKDLEQLFASGTASLHRVLNVPDEVISKLKPGTSLGPRDPNKLASWTHDYSLMSFDTLHVHMEHDIDNYFIVTAIVPWKAVNVPATIAQNVELHWENEVVLNRGENVQIERIRRVSNMGDEIQIVRRDLIGVMMKS